MTTLVLLSVLSAVNPTAFQPKSRPYDAQHYALEVKLGDDGAYKNKLTATLKATKPLTEIELDAYDLKIEMVLVDNEAADFRLKYEPTLKMGTITIKPKKPIAAGKDATVEVSYTGKAGTAHEGFFTVTGDDPNALPYFFTHFEATNAQRFFPCNDQPADKATTEILAIVDGRYTVLANGTKDKDEAFSEGGKNLRRVHWVQDKPHSTYLVALAIGQFEGVPVSDDPQSTIWVAPGRKDRAFIAADVLKGLYNYEAAFVGAKYPWAKLDVVTVPKFFWGGMENTSIIFERESGVLVDHKNDQPARQQIVGLLAHEMAHQWFGDMVTLRWWDDTWLNEGFATYLGMAALDDYNDNDMVEINRATRLVEGYFRQEDGPRSHALLSKTGSSAEEFFDSVSYTKGANVLRMLELWIGKPEMKKALKAYLEKYALKDATSDDFFKAVFDSTKKEKELKPFKDAWLTKRGYPVIFPEASYGASQVTITIRQQPNAAGEKGPFVFKLPIVIHRELEPSYTKEQTILVDKAEVKVSIDVPAAPQWVNWNKDFGALVKVNTTTVPEDQWVDAARHDPDPVWRTIATWNLLGELGNPAMKEETKPTDAALGAILDVLQKDPSSYVREAVLLRMANTRFKRIPKEFAAVALSLAKRPEGLTEDPIGYIKVRCAAMEVLGKTDSPDGHKYLLDELGKKEIDINYLGGFAAGAARIDSSAALTTLRAAMVTQKGRGFGYYRRVVEAMGAFASPDVAEVLRATLKANPGNNELGRTLFRRIDQNFALKQTNEYAKMVRDLVLDESVTEELRGQVLETLDDVKTPGAKEALETIAEKATSERMKASAKQALSVNFPSAAPAPAPAPKKK